MPYEDRLPARFRGANERIDALTTGGS
jgi:hypothetical protein